MVRQAIAHMQRRYPRAQHPFRQPSAWGYAYLSLLDEQPAQHTKQLQKKSECLTAHISATQPTGKQSKESKEKGS
jgi:hypothetical protein